MCRTSADLLQFFSAFGVALAVSLYLCTRMTVAIAISGNLRDAEVNAKRILNFFGGRFQHFADGQQKEIAFVIYKVRLTLSRFKQLLLTFAADIGGFLTARNRPDGDELLFGEPRQNPIVERECGKRFELAKRPGVELIGVRDFGDCSHSHLS